MICCRKIPRHGSMRLPRFSSSLALLLAVVAVLMIAGMLAADLTGSRKGNWADAIRQIEQHDRILAEHVATTFDSIEVLLDEMRVTLQEGSGWQHWNRATGHRNLKSHLTRSLPQIRHLIIFDADGFQRHASFAEAPPPINVSDRPTSGNWPTVAMARGGPLSAATPGNQPMRLPAA